MTSSISQGRRWATALAAATLATTLALPAVAMGAPKDVPPGLANEEQDGAEHLPPGLQKKQDLEVDLTDTSEAVTDAETAAKPGLGCGKPDTPGQNPGQGNASDSNLEEVGNVCGDKPGKDQKDGKPAVGDETKQEEGEPEKVDEPKKDDDPREDDDPQEDKELPVDFCTADSASFTPGAGTGLGKGVAIVAQSLNDAGGWEFIQWEAAPGTKVAAVAVKRGATITAQAAPDANVGLEENLDALILCTEDDDAEEQTEGRTPGSEESPAIDPEKVETISIPGDLTEPITEGLTPVTPEANVEPVPADDGTAVRGVVLQRSDRLTPAPRTDRVSVAAADDGTEVLGVTLARTGTDLGGLAAAGALGLMAGGLVLLSTRRRETDEVAS